MLSVSRLLNGTASEADALRYGRRSRDLPSHLLHYSADKRPVVVWNLTRRCNLHCLHCYADATTKADPDELTTAEGERVLRDLARFGVPVVLFSGGEPLVRPDVFDLARTARELGMRAVLSTNGVLIDDAAVRRIAEAGFSYVGISIDGIGPVHDKLRGQVGAFNASIAAIRRLRAAGVRVGLRFTVHAKNVDQLSAVFDLLEAEDIPRCCVYHLAYAGRGGRISKYDLTHEQTRAVLDQVIARTEDFHARGIEKEVLTVDNHADAAYLYLHVRRRHPGRAAEVYRLLEWNGGNQSGVAIGSVDPHGEVHADQFSWHYGFGSVRERPFGDIWTDLSNRRLAILKDRASLLPERCRGCRWLALCNGNLRARAEHATGDFLGMDPACYLNDEEIENAAALP